MIIRVKFLVLFFFGLVMSGCVSQIVKSPFTSENKPSDEVISSVEGKIVQPSNMAKGPSNDLVVSGYMRRYGIVSSRKLTSYLNSVEEKLVKAGGFKDFHPTVYVVAGYFPTAWSTPDDQIFVTLGLLARLENEDQLAFILGHETKHIVFNDFSASQYKDFLNKGAGIAQTLSYLNWNGQQVIPQSFVDGVSWSSRLSSIILPQWTKHQEWQADEMSVDLLARSGYSLDSALASSRILLEVAQAFERKQKSSREKLDDKFGSDIKKIGTGNGDVNTVLSDILAKAKQGASSLSSSLADSHGSSVDRLHNLQGYINGHYPISSYPWRAPETAEFKKVFSSRDVKSIFLSFDLLKSSLINADSGKDKMARRLMYRESRVHSKLGYDIRHAMRAEILAQLGDKSLSKSILDRLVYKRKTKVYRAYTDLADLYSSSGDFDSAAKVYQLVLGRFSNSHGDVYVDIVKNYHRAGDAKNASHWILECTQNAPSYSSVCANAAGYGRPPKSLGGAVGHAATTAVFSF